MSTQYILQKGEVIDNKYKIDRIISSSNFSVTYIATDISLNRQVAIKEYFPQIAERSQNSPIVRINDKKTAEYFKMGLCTGHFSISY